MKAVYKKRVGVGYDSLYAEERHSWTYNWFSEVDGPLILSALTRKSLDVLDVGCGSGRLMEVFCHQKAPPKLLVGVEISRAGIASAHRRLNLPFTHFLRCDAEHLPFRGRSFDIVVCVGVLPHVVHPKILLKEVLFVARNMGKVIVTTANSVGAGFMLGRVLSILNPRGKPDHIPPRYAHTLNSMRALLKPMLGEVELFPYKFVPTEIVGVIDFAFGRHEQLMPRILSLLMFLEMFSRRLPVAGYLSVNIMAKIMKP